MKVDGDDHNQINCMVVQGFAIGGEVVSGRCVEIRRQTANFEQLPFTFQAGRVVRMIKEGRCNLNVAVCVSVKQRCGKWIAGQNSPRRRRRRRPPFD